MRQGTRNREALQLGLLFWAHFKAGFGPSGKHKTAYRNSFNIASYLWDTTLGEARASPNLSQRARKGGARGFPENLKKRELQVADSSSGNLKEGSRVCSPALSLIMN